MIPRYGEWEQRFGKTGLSVVGVHTPELEHERDERRLRTFAVANRIVWPVLLDPDYRAWDRFQIQAWPTIILVDRDCVVRGVFIGDRSSTEIETTLRRLL
jgi:hypothetical protein